jgi:hypothetical protein
MFVKHNTLKFDNTNGRKKLIMKNNFINYRETIDLDLSVHKVSSCTKKEIKGARNRQIKNKTIP